MGDKIRQLEDELDAAETDEERVRISERLAREVYKLQSKRRKRGTRRDATDPEE